MGRLNMNTSRRRIETEKTLPGQKVVADTVDTVSVPLSKDEIELLIAELCVMSITDKRALNMYQKLTKKLEALEGEQEGA